MEFDKPYTMLYTRGSYQITVTAEFDKWFKRLRDRQARSAIIRRVDRFAQGNFGDFKSVGENIYEARIDVGKGYRCYFIQRGTEVILLLFGGNKSTQKTDIIKAKAIARAIKEER